MKKKTIIILIAVVVVIGLIVGIFAGSYNNFVKMEENVQAAQSTVSVYLQRRADLIPNFVETVKGYSDYEQSTLTAVTEARSAVKNATTVGEQDAANSNLTVLSAFG